MTGGTAWDVADTTVVASVLPGGSEFEKFQTWMKRVGDFLLTLKTKDGQPVPIIFRPWHENNGSWFWWGQKLCSDNEFLGSEEYANLDKKREVIAKLKDIAEEAGENIQEKVQTLVEEYNAIGHVPFKEKDKIYEEYHAVLDKLYKDLNISVAKRRLNNFKQNLKQVAERGENALDNERARLFRQYEAIKQEVQTYENNLGFLSVSSKKGSSLIDEMNRKVQKLKDDMQLVKEKIKAIDAENQEKE